MKTKEIAELLGVTDKSVNGHLKELFPDLHIINGVATELSEEQATKIVSYYMLNSTDKIIKEKAYGLLKTTIQSNSEKVTCKTVLQVDLTPIQKNSVFENIKKLPYLDQIEIVRKELCRFSAGVKPTVKKTYLKNILKMTSYMYQAINDIAEQELAARELPEDTDIEVEKVKLIAGDIEEYSQGF